MAWTVDKIVTHFNGSVSPETAETVLGIIRGTVDPCSVSEHARAWVARCHHAPRQTEIQLRALVQLLEGYDDCAIWGSDPYHPAASYVNTGDTYSPTLLLDRIAGKWRLTTFGDFVETYERRYQLQ